MFSFDLGLSQASGLVHKSAISPESYFQNLSDKNSEL